MYFAQPIDFFCLTNFEKKKKKKKKNPNLGVGAKFRHSFLQPAPLIGLSPRS